jgi:phage terminase large subunit-like protein
VTARALASVTAETAAETLARLRATALTAQTEQEAEAVTREIRALLQRVRLARWEAYVWQRPHVHPPDWVSTRAPGVCDEQCAEFPDATLGVHQVWTQRGGRGTGKTEGAAHYVNDHVNGPPCDTRVPGGHRLTIVGPTQPDTVSSCVTGVSGLQAVDPAIEVSVTKEGTLVRWPNGAVARVLGAHTAQDVQRARAWTNVCLWWLEEFAAMQHPGGLIGTPGYTGAPGMLDQAPFTLRLHEPGAPSFPHIVATTTPTGRPEVAELLARQGTQTWGRTRDADKLDPTIRESLEALYPPGTTIGRQELDGELVGDVAGALWVTTRPEFLEDGTVNPDERPGIENDRLPAGSVGWVTHGRPDGMAEKAKAAGLTLPTAPTIPEAPALTVHRVVVAVDPPGGRTECGITVEASAASHGYTLADLSLKAPPNTWAMVALCAYFDYGAEGLVIEETYGGDMVPNTVSTLCTLLGIPAPPIFKAKTKVGKRLRAEPVQALYQQHREHHVGHLVGLQTEQTTWVPNETKDSPNRIDAHVHGQTYLLVKHGPSRLSNPARSQARVPGVPTEWTSSRGR